MRDREYRRKLARKTAQLQSALDRKADAKTVGRIHREIVNLWLNHHVGTR